MDPLPKRNYSVLHHQAGRRYSGQHKKTAALNISNILRSGRNQSRSRAETGQSVPPERGGCDDLTFQEQLGFCMMRLVRIGTNRETITLTARTGKIGDWKVFVYNLAQVVSSRTGETGGALLITIASQEKLL